MKLQLIRTVLTLALVLSAAVQADARTLEGKFKVGKQALVLRVVDVQSGTDDRDLTQKEAEFFASLVVDVAQMVQPLNIPRTVQLNLAQLSFSPSANAMNSELNLGVRFAMKDEAGRVHTQNPNVMRAVTAHEFGHLVFAQNVISRLPIVPALERYSREAGEIESFMKKLRDEAEKLEARATAQGGMTPEIEAKIQKIEDEFNQWLEELTAVQAKFNEVLALYKRTSPYNEFFADVVSLLYTENANAIAEGIHFSHPNEGNRRIRNVRRSEILNREFEAGRVGPVFVASPHGLFYQVRELLWDNYLSRPSVMRNEKTRVLKALTRAVTTEVMWLVQQPELPTNRENITLMNKRLWSQIEKELNGTTR